MYAYSNNGLSYQWQADGYIAKPGEVLFDHLASDSEIGSAFSGYAAAKAAVDQAKVALAAYNAAITGGLQIQSTATPALNGTYSIDDGSQKNISGIAAGIASRNRLPGGGSTFDYPDVTVTDHAFTAQNFLDFASAVEDYVYALSKGLTPTQPVVIA